MHQARPGGAVMNVGVSTPSGRQRLKAHLVAGPSGNSQSYNRSQLPDNNVPKSTPYVKTAGSKENAFFPLSSSPHTAIASNFQAVPNPSESRTGSSISKSKVTVTLQSSAGMPAVSQPIIVQPLAHDKPAAPLPIRKYQAKSPPMQLQSPMALVHQNSQKSNLVKPDPSTTMVDSSRQSSQFSSFDSAFGHPNNINNRHAIRKNDPSSGGSPLRNSRASAFSTASPSRVAPSTRDHGIQQATVIRAPSVGSAAADIVTGVASQQSIFSDRSSMGSSDVSSKMTISELRSFAERQRQLITRQAQNMQVKEERLAWLRAVHVHTVGGNLPGSIMLPPPGSQLTHEQEKCLHKLRNIRGQTEQARLKNENLVNEIDLLSRSLSAKEIELEAFRQRAEEAGRSLSLVNTCYLWLSKGTTTRSFRSADKVEPMKPFHALSVQLPFRSDKDKKHWQDGLLEADRLDRQIAQALQRNSHTKRSVRADALQPAELASSKRKDEIKSVPSEGIDGLSCTSRIATTSDVPSVSAAAAPVSAICSRRANVQTACSDFNSLLSRASSPPTSRRSSLRMLLHAAAVSGDSRAISCFPRLKTPPRYASRAVINDTYMRKICMDSVEKYKKTANEIYRANVERMYAKQQHSGSESDKSADLLANKDAMEPGEVKLTSNDVNRLPTYHSVVRSSSPTDSVSSSSSSSLELIGIEQNVDESKQTNDFDLNPMDDEAKQSIGDVDSGLGGSDDTGQSEQNAVAPSPLAQRVTVFVDDSPGTDASLSNTSFIDGGPNFLKPILRKSIGKSKDASAPTEVADDPAPLSNSSPSRTTSVRFHPLALLLDAALEGDLDLVKEVSSKVSDVSEPNDEGITALHNAVCAGRTEIADFLVRVAGADVNAGDTDGWTPLHCAASCGNLPLARLLVEHGASLHARTLSDQETPLEKCDQGDDEAECEEYLFFQQERLGSAASGIVYVLFPRGLEASGPGSADAHIQPDELAVYPNEQLRVVDREPAGEPEWMLAEKSDGTRGLIPRSHISCYPLVRVPPASLPMPLLPIKPPPSALWDGDDDDVSDESPSRPDDVRDSTVIEVVLPNADIIDSCKPSLSECCDSTSTSVAERRSPVNEEERPELKTSF